MPEVNVDSLIERALAVGTSAASSLTNSVKWDEIMALCVVARDVFLSQPSMIEVEPPVRICGDVHGQYSDLLRLLSRGGFPPAANYLFLGDYVDRGRQNLETIILLLAYKVKYPENFFLLRGNHECAQINSVYGFLNECERRYNEKTEEGKQQEGNMKHGMRVWNAFQLVFATMPLTALVAGKIFCMHGGLSKDITSFDQLRQKARPMEPQNPSIEMDLLWADPDRRATQPYAPNTRGVSYVFSDQAVKSFCTTMGIDMVARAHQVVQDGYEFFADRRLVTLFSAPHYCGEFDNAAATMIVDEDLQCSFEVFKPIPKKR